MRKPKNIILVVVSLLLIAVAVFALNYRLNGTGSYIGLSEDEAVDKAQNRNAPYRVVRRDAESLPITHDLRPNRLNFEIDNGIVTKASKY